MMCYTSLYEVKFRPKSYFECGLVPTHYVLCLKFISTTKQKSIKSASRRLSNIHRIVEAFCLTQSQIHRWTK